VIARDVAGLVNHLRAAARDVAAAQIAADHHGAQRAAAVDETGGRRVRPRAADQRARHGHAGDARCGADPAGEIAGAAHNVATHADRAEAARSEDEAGTVARTTLQRAPDDDIRHGRAAEDLAGVGGAVPLARVVSEALAAEQGLDPYCLSPAVQR
jgi:hypothetical protein